MRLLLGDLVLQVMLLALQLLQFAGQQFELFVAELFWLLEFVGVLEGGQEKFRVTFQNRGCENEAARRR